MTTSTTPVAAGLLSWNRGRRLMLFLLPPLFALMSLILLEPGNKLKISARNFNSLFSSGFLPGSFGATQYDRSSDSVHDSTTTISHIEDFNRKSFERRMEVFRQSPPIYWAARNHFRLLQQELRNDLDDASGNASQEIWKDENRYLHVAILHLNENWGAFSGYVPNRTVNWASMNQTFGNCGYDEAMSYLNHPNTLAVVTVQFQNMAHPKVHSLPLGLSDALHSAPGVDQFFNRTQLLMINAAASPERKGQIETVIRNFNGTVQNTYGQGHGVDSYINELQRSKFIMSPSGMGWDCYRHWEALVYGAIPIIEHYNRSDGWFRVFDGLPVSWVSTFEEVTPEFLHSEYVRHSNVQNYAFEKLTSAYWINFIHSLRPKHAKRGPES
ncbi:hypothetical protein IV203_030311 [Nitzschia inconspicua]|uniref:RXYLT1 C-terminal domain-containing protein n=1 Tax=Nitzschia inconspicua TaxID=303405 RepID=A0A9K3LSA4_9STRA|nr:hypothetical protein IV203_030311 [Nitzschia inconspicua]